ncbi:flagellar hook-basal body complex protein [Methylomonas sp. AM2-LC]|uniref:flagellar hook-basal body complex protein n=1 Tax=Methylomonas sp. AM2-LC TaxID=3153301 RepID=UPI0032664CDF
MTFSTALSGLNAANNDLSVTGNNIANSNTDGFKKSRSEFADVYASSVGGVSKITPGSGVSVANDAQQFIQGTLQSTSNNLDMAISGGGFFTLAQSPTNTNNLSYSRDGEFQLDKDGYLVNNQGNAVLAYAPNGTTVAAGFSTGVLQPVQINTLTGPPTPSSTISLNVNLNASSTQPSPPVPTSTVKLGLTLNGTDAAPANSTFSPTDATSYNSMTTTTVNDSQGNPQTLSSYFVYTGADANGNIAYTVHNFISDPNTPNVLTELSAGPFTSPPTTVTASTPPTTGTLTFDPTSGALVSPATGEFSLSAYSATPSTGAKPLTISNLNFSGTQFTGSAFAVNSKTQNGVPTGQAPFNPANSSTYNSQTSVTIYDSLGSPHIVTTYFVNVGSRLDSSGNSVTDWDAYHYISDPATPTVQTPLNATPIGTSTSTATVPAATATTPIPGDLTFSSSGKIISPSGGNFALSSYTINPPTGAAPITISNMNYTGSTQVQQAFSVNGQTQNGLPAGQLTGVSIDITGVISANFSNGGSLPLGQVAISNFSNTNGLSKVGSTSWKQSASSGPATLGVAGSGSLGTIEAGSVETSNVNLSNELVNLIVAQQAYQANAKTITTENNIMTSILQIA